MREVAFAKQKTEGEKKADYPSVSLPLDSSPDKGSHRQGPIWNRPLR